MEPLKKGAARPELNKSAAARVAEAAKFLADDELPAELKPTADNRELQAGLLWGDDTFVEVRSHRFGEPIVAGDAPKAHFQIFDSRLGREHTLFAPDGKEFNLLVPDGIEWEVSRAGKKVEVRTDAVQVPFKGKKYRLELDDRVVVKFGRLALVARFIGLGKTRAEGVGKTVDLFLTKVILLSALAHIALVAAFLITPIDTEILSEDLFKNPNRFAKYIVRPQEKEKFKKKELSGVKEGAKAKGDEGKFGKKEAKQKDAAPSKKGAPVVDVNKREEDRKKIAKLLDWLPGGAGEGAASNMFGPGGLGTGINSALGGLKGGAGMGDAHGVGGLGSRGFGSGGGGTALGIGGLGTKGGGRGAGGYGSLDLGGRGKDETQFVPGRTIVVGGLSKEVIGRIIRRHWTEIKYCYEKELSKDPNLNGKVAIQFTIDAAGSVADVLVKEDTMGSSEVNQCMKDRIFRWKFPQPQGGGIVQVTYPWVFKPAG
jgi:TonB family protein